MSHKTIPTNPILNYLQNPTTISHSSNKNLNSLSKPNFIRESKGSESVIFEDYKPFSINNSSELNNKIHHSSSSSNKNETKLIKKNYESKPNLQNFYKKSNQVVSNDKPNALNISHGKHYSLNEAHLKSKIYFPNNETLKETKRKLSSRKIDKSEDMNNVLKTKSTNPLNNIVPNSSNFISFHHKNNVVSTSPQFLSFHQKKSSSKPVPVPSSHPTIINNNTGLSKHKSSFSTKNLPFIKHRYKSQKIIMPLSKLSETQTPSTEVTYSNNKASGNVISNMNDKAPNNVIPNKYEKVHINTIRRNYSMNSGLTSFRKINQYENNNNKDKDKQSNHSNIQPVHNEHNKLFLNQIQQNQNTNSLKKKLLRKKQILNKNKIQNPLSTTLNKQIYSERSVTNKSYNLFNKKNSSFIKYLPSYVKVSSNQNK